MGTEPGGGALQYRPCDLCGSLVQAQREPGATESVLCEGCLRTRRVRPEPVDGGKPKRHAKHIHKFRCPCCHRKLRSKPVSRDVELDCPACGAPLVIAPGGAVTSPDADEADAPIVRRHRSLDSER